MEYIVTYLIYVLALVAVIAIFNWAHIKLETIRLKHRLLKDLVDNSKKIKVEDLNNYLKS